MRTLNELSQLRDTRFGQPDPRHGLRLLWWFSNECVRIDNFNNMTAVYSPTDEASGFHRFYNRVEDDEDRLLPGNNLPYYEVGNLNNPGKLPHYVTQNYNRTSSESNADRIIVRLGSYPARLDKVYVTKHSDQFNFDQIHTYRISQGLIKTIKHLSLEEFLRQMRNSPQSYTGPQSYTQPQSYTGPQSYTQPQSYTGPQSYTQPQSYTGPQSYTQPQSYTRPQSYTGPRSYTPPQYYTPPRSDDSTCLCITALIFVIILAFFLLVALRMKT